MALELKKGAEFKKEFIPQGSHPARIYEIVELGTIDTNFGPKRTVRFTFELPEEKRVFKEGKGEQPMVISKDLTVSSHEKSGMRALIEACLGIGLFQGEADTFDIKKIMGETCLIQVKHKEGDKGKFQYVDGFSALPKSMKVEEAINEPRIYEIDKHDEKVFDSLPDFVKDKIKSSDEWKDAHKDTIDVDEIPF